MSESVVVFFEVEPSLRVAGDGSDEAKEKFGFTRA
jgi:hypothetical protein